MAVPSRTHQAGTFFVTAVSARRRRMFQVQFAAELIWQHLQENRQRANLLHAFVIMPDHLHLLITPNQSLEYAMQILKGGFSRKFHEVAHKGEEVWQRGFTDHRIRNREDFMIRKLSGEQSGHTRTLSKAERLSLVVGLQADLGG